MDDWGERSSWRSGLRKTVNFSPFQRLIATIVAVIVCVGPHAHIGDHHVVYLGQVKDDHLYDDSFDAYHDVYSRIVIIFLCVGLIALSVSAVETAKGSMLSGFVQVGRLVVTLFFPIVLIVGIFMTRLAECNERENTGYAMWLIVSFAFSVL